MALRVNTNVEAINVHNTLLLTNNKVADSLKRLSSGKRINSARDDASGLAVANNFRAKISSMRVASQNAAEANSMLQVADGAYSKITDILVRMRDLATQASSDQTEQRGNLQTEFLALQNEIDRIAGATKYGNMTVTNADITYTFQVGAGGASNTNDVLGVDFKGVNTTKLALTTASVAIGGTATGSAVAAMSAIDAALTSMNGYMANIGAYQNRLQYTMENLAISIENFSASESAIDAALTSMNGYMANIGAYQNRLQYTMENLAISIENFSASESAIRDADMAYEMTIFTKNQILQQTGIAMLSQANSAPQQIMQLLGR